MSTRGYVGIRKNGEDKGGYNHYDSYPDGLGVSILKYIKNNTLESLEEDFNKITLEKYNTREDAWTYGDCLNVNMNVCNEFLYDSLFYEYAYIINLDTNMLEFYTGFNKDPNANGRYAKFTVYERDPDDRYYGVVLKMEIPLEEIFKDEWKVDNDEFVRK